MAFGGKLDLLKHRPPQVLPYKPVSVSKIYTAQRERQSIDSQHAATSAVHKLASGTSEKNHSLHDLKEFVNHGARKGGVGVGGWALRMLFINAAFGAVMSLGGRHIMTSSEQLRLADRAGVWVIMVGAAALYWGLVSRRGEESVDETSFGDCEDRDIQKMQQRLEAEEKNKILGKGFSVWMATYSRLSMLV